MHSWFRQAARACVVLISGAIAYPAISQHRNPYDDLRNWVDSAVREKLAQVGRNVSLEGPAECRMSPTMAVMFAPGTPKEVKDRVMRNVSGDVSLYYQLNARWSSTANGGTGAQGNPVTLTWSIVPDGVFIPNGGLGSGSNVLNARLTAQFGSGTLWKDKLRESFNRWDQVSGLTLVETVDDGAALHGSAGVLNVRGDVRLSGFDMGTGSGVLAYNYFPNNGDMVINTSWGWNNATNNHRFLRNTVMHEHGHGFGMNHVDPTNGTKLMEAFLNTNFDGPQDDDIQGCQRHYGDVQENNDTNATRRDLGTVTNGQTIEFLSIDDDADDDWSRIFVPPGKVVTITAQPIGSTYLQGPQGGGTANRNSLAIHNLRIRAYRTDGVTLLATSDATAAGVSEVMANLVPPLDNLVHLNVDCSDAANDIQRYRLILNLAALTEAYVPGAFQVFRGVLVGGDIASLANSDDNSMVIQKGLTLNPAEAPIQLIVESTARTNTVSVLKFKLEARASFTVLQQTIELYNFNTNMYETVDQRAATTTDSVVEAVINSSADRFVQAGSNLMRAKVSYKPVGPIPGATFQAAFDQTLWTLTYQ